MRSLARSLFDGRYGLSNRWLYTCWIVTGYGLWFILFIILVVVGRRGFLVNMLGWAYDDDISWMALMLSVVISHGPLGARVIAASRAANLAWKEVWGIGVENVQFEGCCTPQKILLIVLPFASFAPSVQTLVRVVEGCGWGSDCRGSVR